MCDVEKKLNVSWQLVSQFVSWDFCRYMCEQSENLSSETDVLTFLRNMMVSRTEKRATEITKQEIVAKFIMEIKMIRSKSRMKCIVDLSETVKKICPELNMSITNLLYHLEHLLNVLQWNKDSEKDQHIIRKIDKTVYDFTSEACKLLPLPDLLQVVAELQARVLKARQKPVTNDELYRRVVNCLRKEKITLPEAKTIAKVLYEDKTFENFFNSATEVEADSQQNSLILNSQQNIPFVSSQQNSPFLKSRQKSPLKRPQSFQSPGSKQTSNPLQLFSHDDEDQEKQLDSDVLFNLQPIYPQSQQYIPGTQDSLEPSSQQSLAPSEQFRVIEGIQKLGSLNPIETYLFKSSYPEPLIPSAKPQDKVHHNEETAETHSDISDFSPQIIAAKNKHTRRLSSPEPEFYTAPDEALEDNVVNVESDVSSDFCPEKLHPSNKHRKRYVLQIDSDLDLSDEEVLFVAPRVSNIKEKSANSWVKNFFVDNHSGSDTSDCDQDDECRFLTPTMFKTGATQTQEKRPAPNAVIWSSDDETHNSSVVTDAPSSQHHDDPTFRIHQSKKNSIVSQSPPQTREKKKVVATKRIRKTQLQSPKALKTAKQTTLSGFGFSSDTSCFSSPKEVATKKVPEKKHFRLFDNDLMPNVSNESALFEKPTLKKKPKKVQKIEELGKKRRCVECKITFKTPRELKKHVFIVHTMEDFDSTEESM